MLELLQGCRICLRLKVGRFSVLNYVVYVRGNAGDFDQWAQMGNQGWSYKDVLPYFRRAETNAKFNDAYHGQDGPLSVETNGHAHPLCEMFIEAAMSLGLPFNPDFNGESQWGCGYYQATTKNGKRSSTVAAYLDPVRGRDNLIVVKNAQVLRIGIETGRATGIECILDGAKIETLRAESQVILSAGSIGTPHLLMLSGVGPSEHLNEHGIKTIFDNPNVGQHLKDHLGMTPVSAFLRDPDGLYVSKAQSFEEHLKEFEGTSGGALASLQLDAGAFFSVDPGFEYPQCQTYFSVYPGESDERSGGTSKASVTAGGYICKSKSRGSVTLATSNPLDAPLIDPNYLSEPNDLRVQIEHVKWNIDVLNAKPFDKIRDGAVQPEFRDDREIETFIRQNASTIWHPTGTCRMGAERHAVVDPKLKVHGIEGLSICDASVMPTMTSGNINAPVIMIAEKGADLIRART